MASAYIPVSFQRLWSIWNIRGFMIMSLTVQLVLSLTAPLRPKTSNIFIIFVVWSAYFLADWTAIFAFGLISTAGSSKSPSHVMVSNDLRALWASFLLIHLGGPDNITAFSLEDNALWLRHLVGLIAQVFSFAYIFAKTLPDNKLMATTVLVFAAGVINYGDKTRALYLTSLYNFKETSIKLLYEDDDIDLGTPIQGRVDNPEEKLRIAYDFFRILRCLIVDITPDQSQRRRSREFFCFVGYITEQIGIAEAIAKFRYTSKVDLVNGIWKFTFNSLKERASDAHEPNRVREVYEPRGELALRGSSNELKPYVTEFVYDQNATLWHIATDICYNTDQNLDKDNENVRFSKIFSDYMIYLLVKQPDMMSAVSGIFHKSYRDTCRKLKRLEERVKVETFG